MRATCAVVGVLLLLGTIGCGSAGSGSPSPEDELLDPAGSAIQSYLTKHFTVRGWLPKVHEIEVRRDTATVTTSLPAGARRTAENVCAAVVQSPFAERAVVRFGSRSSVGCN